MPTTEARRSSPLPESLTRQAMYVYGNNETRSCGHSCCGKTINITYSKCVSKTSDIQYETRMRRIIPSYMARPVYHVFPHYLKECMIFRKKNVTKPWIFLQYLSETFVIIRRIQLDIIIKVRGKAIPLQAWTGLEGSRSVRLPDFKTIGTWKWWGCQPYAPDAFTPRKHFWYSFLLGAESTPGP
jgi:hypothetical protein